MAARPGGAASGLIIGKFMPPHRGHVACIDFARRVVDRLTILVCSLPGEPIPGETRAAWVRELFPDCRVAHVTDENPSLPEDHPDFWAIWRATVRRWVPHAEGPDFLFAGESYGTRLAQEIGARFVPFDRELIPVSGTAVRERPMRYWDYLPECVRPHFARRVCVVGPESAGKTTLARELARLFDTVWVPEYARPLIESQDNRVSLSDIPLIARGQAALEESLVRRANRVLVCDTDAITTTLWSDTLYDDCPTWVRELARTRKYDATLLLSPDRDWVADPQRVQPDPADRWAFFQALAERLTHAGRPFTVVSGDWPERLAAGRAAIEAVLSEPRAGSGVVLG